MDYLDPRDSDKHRIRKPVYCLGNQSKDLIKDKKQTHRTKPVKFIHEKAFDKMGGYLYHSHIQISKSF